MIASRWAKINSCVTVEQNWTKMFSAEKEQLFHSPKLCKYRDTRKPLDNFHIHIEILHNCTDHQPFLVLSSDANNDIYGVNYDNTKKFHSRQGGRGSRVMKTTIIQKFTATLKSLEAKFPVRTWYENAAF